MYYNKMASDSNVLFSRINNIINQHDLHIDMKEISESIQKKSITLP